MHQHSHALCDVCVTKHAVPPTPTLPSLSTVIHCITSIDMEDTMEASPSAAHYMTDPENTLAPNIHLIPVNNMVRELQTIIRNEATPRSDFIFYSDRLIRLVIEEGLNYLPVDEVKVTTPYGGVYDGVRFTRGNCGVSINRSGEAMEKALRECCRSIRIGKVLIEKDAFSNEATLLYTRFPTDVADRRVLLLYPIMHTGQTVRIALDCLINHGAKEENIFILTLFSTPKAALTAAKDYPQMTIITSEILDFVPKHFGQRYFCTDDD